MLTTQQASETLSQDAGNTLLTTRYNNGRSAWVYLFARTIPDGVRYGVRYYDTRADDTFCLHYYHRSEADHDCDTWLAGHAGRRPFIQAHERAS